MKRIIFKILIIILTTFLIFVIYSQKSEASILDDIFSQAEDWTSTGKSHTNQTMNTDTINEASSSIYNTLMAVAVIVAVIVGAILGIRLMMAGLDEKVDAKQGLLTYVVSCIIVFGALGIWKLVIVILTNIK